MIDINKIYATHELFDGHYKLVRPIDKDDVNANLWLAIDVNSIESNAAASNISSGKRVLLRIFQTGSITDIEEEQRLQDEFDQAHECLHPNLVPPEVFSAVGDTHYLVFPYTESEPLSQLVGKNLSENTVWDLIADISSALDKLHTHQPRIVHNDIRPANILSYNSESFALTNYGIHLETESGTLAYCAPERFQNASKPRPESDIWALGATLYEVVTGNKPFGNKGGKEQKKETPLPPIPNQPKEISDLICSCLNADPKKRPNARQINNATRHKTNRAKQKKDKQHKKNKTPLLIAASVVLIAGIVYFLIPKHPSDTTPTPIHQVTLVDPYEKAITLLSEQSTAPEGLSLLDSLINVHDSRAAFLLSRLYFDPRDTDTVLYDNLWKILRENCGIIPNNGTAHEYLFEAFEWNENDFMTLYHLGCDFKAGTVRGCDRNLDYALWCFNRAENLINPSDKNRQRYQQGLENGRDRISTTDHSPLKPKR